ncbi:MAG: NifB/NifX family molybdenum-iron cluster-binding protein [Candidatus Hodarchaeales archaeon]|jgi:predicted Fe-Mo cluster-binding NifX family protein
MKIAFPTISPGGLDSNINPHFGQCNTVTFVTIENKAIKEANVIKPQGGHTCGLLPTLFAQNGADACIVGGIGGRPYMMLQQHGIKTYTVTQDLIDKRVREIIDVFLSNELSELAGGTCQH